MRATIHENTARMYLTAETIEESLIVGKIYQKMKTNDGDPNCSVNKAENTVTISFKVSALLYCAAS